MMIQGTRRMMDKVKNKRKFSAIMGGVFLVAMIFGISMPIPPLRFFFAILASGTAFAAGFLIAVALGADKA